ncbi:MAG TPA: glutathione peroxidase [Spirochaetota bacterium]|nr:glutathione peroxidase [Spirochaetota bacterium]
MKKVSERNKVIWAALLILIIISCGWAANEKKEEKMAQNTENINSIYDFTMDDIDGNPVPLRNYKGKVIMLVNVASKCGFTPQYEALQRIYARYQDRGLVILGFPANDFLWQEPGSNDEIKKFCTLQYNVTFPMFAKISVRGSKTASLYKFLTDKKLHPENGGKIKWNFTKFFIDRKGKVAARFSPKTVPDSKEVITVIERLLADQIRQGNKNEQPLSEQDSG